MSDSVSVQRAPRLLALTGIRFVAAIAVFNAHATPPSGAPLELKTISLAGHDWMTMFFVLSGLILAWNYDDLLSRRLNLRGLRTYFVARFARIYPLYLLALAFAIISTFASGAQIVALVTSGEFWLHVFALQTWSGDLGVAYGLNSPAWSIGVEFFLYALLPLLLLIVARFRDSWRALLAIGLGAIVVLFALTLAFQLLGLADLPRTDPSSAHRWLYRTPLTRIPDFVVGIVLCYLVKLSAGKRLEFFGRIGQAVGGVLTVALMLIPPIAYSVWSYDSFDLIPFALLMLGLVWAPDTVLARALGSRIGVFLGEASFAFYLFHQTIIDLVGRAGGGYADWIVAWVTAFLLTTLAAAGAHVLFERPVRSWLRRRLDPKPPIFPVPVGAQAEGVPTT
jgi:peptidoglycan/LPS O-acetylase OafA/YrhL